MLLLDRFSGASSGSARCSGELGHPTVFATHALPPRTAQRSASASGRTQADSTSLKCQQRTSQARWQRLRPAAEESSASPSAEVASPAPFGAGVVKELPIFPLGIVAFPTGDVPLNIFEARYRVLFSTLLAGSDGIDTDLVNEEKPWAGSRLFGMCFASQGGMATVGTTLHITAHDRLPDGRLFINSKGIEKFRVLKIIEERPVLVCQVEMLEDSDDQGPGAKGAANETVQLFRDLIELNVRMNRIPNAQARLDPKLEEMSPREVSYWLGLVFSQNPALQQALLEESSLLARLAQEKEILEGTTKFLRAKVALQSAFTADGDKLDSGGSGSGPAAGSSPDSPKGPSSSEQPPGGSSGPD